MSVLQGLLKRRVGRGNAITVGVVASLSRAYVMTPQPKSR